MQDVNDPPAPTVLLGFQQRNRVIVTHQDIVDMPNRLGILILFVDLREDCHLAVEVASAHLAMEDRIICKAFFD